MRLIHQKVLEQQDRQKRGILEPDRAMSAVSAPSPDKKFLFILVSETRLGMQRAAVFKSVEPGDVVYSAEDVRDEAIGDAAFVARAQAYALDYTHIPAITRKYPKKEENPQ
jgi:hypothetical protein